MMLSRNVLAIVIGIGTIVLAALYGALAPVLGYQVEWAGVTMLFALGIALGVMVFVLHTGPGR